MVRRVYLHGRANLRYGADDNRGHIQDYAIEVEKYSVAEANVVTIVAVKRRSDHNVFADRREPFDEKRVSIRVARAQCRVVANHPCSCDFLIRLKFGITREIKLSSQHFLLIGSGQ